MKQNAKEIYREFADQESSLPLFSRAWWLDASAGPDGWNAAVVEKGGRVIAAMPYALRRRYGLKLISQPALTPRLGPWFRSDEANPTQKLANEKELMQALIDQLPAFDYFNQNWHCEYTNWLPFSWNGFQQSTYYTYRLHDLSDLEKLWNGLQQSIRGHCKKAASRFHLTMRDDLTFDEFMVLNRMTYTRQGLRMPYSDAHARRIDAACVEHACRKFIIAVDDEGRHHAGAYIVWDENTAYGLMNGADPALRHSQANSLCFWECIKYAATVSPRYDFAGSVVESIERFFRAFGTTQVPYFNIRKTPSRLLRIRQGLLSVVRG